MKGSSAYRAPAGGNGGTATDSARRPYPHLLRHPLSPLLDIAACLYSRGLMHTYACRGPIRCTPHTAARLICLSPRHRPRQQSSDTCVYRGLVGCTPCNAALPISLSPRRRPPRPLRPLPPLHLFRVLDICAGRAQPRCTGRSAAHLTPSYPLHSPYLYPPLHPLLHLHVPSPEGHLPHSPDRPSSCRVFDPPY